MTKTLVKDVVNPERTTVPPNSCFLPEGENIYDLPLDAIPPEVDYICAVSEAGECVGTVKAERIRRALRITRETSLTGLLDEVDDAIISIDAQGTIFYVNPSYRRTLKVAAGQLLGKDLHKVEPGSALLDALHEGRTIDVERKRIRTLDLYAAVHAFPMFSNGKLVGATSIIRDVTEVHNLREELEYTARMAEEYSRQIEAQAILKRNSIIGESRVFVNSVMKANAVAATDATVLLRGENGVGKEVFVNLIQQNSARNTGPFITMNCAAVPESLVESELFGYEEGSFTGAQKGGRLGKFQLAEGGTLFLDEIGDMPMPMQAKLLRVLQEGEIEKIGRQKPIAVNVRVIAATNQPLERMVKEGKFRQDLFYRLNVVPINVPALRERGHDVVLLAAHYLEQYNKKYGKQVKMEEEVYRQFLKYDWPGNVRELQNVVESCVVLSSSGVIRTGDLPDYLIGMKTSEDSVQQAVGMDLPERLDEAVEACERAAFLSALRKSGNNRQKAIEILGVTRRTFYRKVKELQIPLE